MTTRASNILGYHRIGPPYDDALESVMPIYYNVVTTLKQNPRQSIKILANGLKDLRMFAFLVLCIPFILFFVFLEFFLSWLCLFCTVLSFSHGLFDCFTYPVSKVLIILWMDIVSVSSFSCRYCGVAAWTMHFDNLKLEGVGGEGTAPPPQMHNCHCFLTWMKQINIIVVVVLLLLSAVLAIVVMAVFIAVALVIAVIEKITLPWIMFMFFGHAFREADQRHKACRIANKARLLQSGSGRILSLPNGKTGKTKPTFAASSCQPWPNIAVTLWKWCSLLPRNS